MKIYLSILFTLASLYGFSQKKDRNIQSEYGRTMNKGKVIEYLDSLKISLLLDTANYSRDNLIHTSVGTLNKEPNSPLFVVNGKYMYDLDIIDGQEVKEFTESLLDYKIIKEIVEVKPEYARAIYGIYGDQGAILITLKRRVKFNPEIAGLKLKEKRKGDNFEQRKSGEVIIRH